MDEDCHRKLPLVHGFAPSSLYGGQITGDASFSSRYLATVVLHANCPPKLYHSMYSKLFVMMVEIAKEHKN